VLIAILIVGFHIGTLLMLILFMGLCTAWMRRCYRRFGVHAAAVFGVEVRRVRQCSCIYVYLHPVFGPEDGGSLYLRKIGFTVHIHAARRPVIRFNIMNIFVKCETPQVLVCLSPSLNCGRPVFRRHIGLVFECYVQFVRLPFVKHDIFTVTRVLEFII
jgi:hypothetical protein